MKNLDFTFEIDIDRISFSDMVVGKGGVILTTRHPRYGFDCCRMTAGAGDSEIANEFDEMEEELTSYAKCEFRGYQQLTPGARLGNSESTSHTLRQGGLYFRETPWNTGTKRLMRMDFNELIPYYHQPQLNKVNIEVYESMTHWNKPHCPNNLARSV